MTMNIKKCGSDDGLCSGIINGEWCELRYPWAIKSDEDMWCEYKDDNKKQEEKEEQKQRQLGDIMAHEVECLHSEKIDEIDKKLDRLLELVNGNGKIGVAAKVNILWSCTMFLIVTVGGIIAHNILGM